MSFVYVPQECQLNTRNDLVYSNDLSAVAVTLNEPIRVGNIYSNLDSTWSLFTQDPLFVHLSLLPSALRFSLEKKVEASVQRNQ